MAAGKHDVDAIRYIGIAKVRRILETEWAAAGIKNQKGVEWNELNGWTVPGDRFSRDAITVLQHDDGLALLRKEQEEEDEEE